jgi:hypothetical protein
MFFAKKENLSILYPPMPFIIGAGRSGSSLLRLMLDAHPKMAIPAETRFIPDVLTLQNVDNEALRRAFLNTIINSQTWKDFKMSADSLEKELYNITPFDVINGIRTFYRTYAKRHNKPRWGDKSPYLLNIQLISKCLPEARFIHIIRDGRDVALSLKKVWWGPGNNIENAAHFWMDRILEARKQAAGLNKYIEVQYEDLIINPRRILNIICDFVHLNFDEEMLNYYKNASSRLSEMDDRIVNGKVITKERIMEIYKLTSLPPQSSRIGIFRTELPKEEILIFEKTAGKLLKELGYSLISDPK